MFPHQGNRKKVNRSLSVVLGPQNLIIPQKSQIPNTFLDISSKPTLAGTGINTFGHLWNNTDRSPDTLLWLDPTPDSWRNTYPRPSPDINPSPEAIARLILLSESPRHSVCSSLPLTPFSKLCFHFLQQLFDFYPAWRQGPSWLVLWVLGLSLPASLSRNDRTVSWCKLSEANQGDSY